MTRRPLVILVTGAPGAGKSTLAATIAEHMRLPHIERDVILRGIDLTHGSRQNPLEYGIPAYYNVLGFLLDNSVSFVTDGTMYRGVSEEDIKQHLVRRAHVVNLHVRAENEKERFRRREYARTFRSADWVDAHMARLDEIYSDTVDPLDYGVTCIEVDANEAYIPSIEEITAEITNEYEHSKEKT